MAGVFAEPASAAAYAGFLKEKIDLDPETVCVILLTGNGLKDVNAASRKLKIPEHTDNLLDGAGRGIILEEFSDVYLDIEEVILYTGIATGDHYHAVKVTYNENFLTFIAEDIEKWSSSDGLQFYKEDPRTHAHATNVQSVPSMPGFNRWSICLE